MWTAEQKILRLRFTLLRCAQDDISFLPARGVREAAPYGKETGGLMAARVDYLIFWPLRMASRRVSPE